VNEYCWSVASIQLDRPLLTGTTRYDMDLTSEVSALESDVATFGLRFKTETERADSLVSKTKAQVLESLQAAVSSVRTAIGDSERRLTLPGAFPDDDYPSVLLIQQASNSALIREAARDLSRSFTMLSESAEDLTKTAITIQKTAIDLEARIDGLGRRSQGLSAEADSKNEVTVLELSRTERELDEARSNKEAKEKELAGLEQKHSTMKEDRNIFRAVR
jgi:hypothetical protein